MGTGQRTAVGLLLLAVLCVAPSASMAAAAEGGGLDLFEAAPRRPTAKGRKRPPKPKTREGLFAECLQGPLAGIREIVFAVRPYGNDGHWYANFGTWSSDPDRKMYSVGARLCRLDLRTKRATTILADARGGIRDPQVHYGATKILFSYRKGGTEHYHLYEIHVDGTGLRQLTNGDCDDIEPAYLPDGGIVFCSSRCNRYVQCWFTHVAVLYRCEADGTKVRLISANVEHDNTPWPLPDGRVLFTRWEYVDRSQVRYHHLWTVNPDGTGQMVYFGNMHPGLVMIDAKPIAGTQKVLAVFSPGHGRRSHAGNLALIDPASGPDHVGFAPVITQRADWRDPYPVTDDCFLAARENGLYVMNAQGYYEQFHAVDGPAMKAHEPRPLRPRPRERVIPPRSNWAKATGTLILADVTRGRNMAGVRPGEIKKLLVLETLPKPVNFSGGMSPVTPSGSFTIPRILGTVPVEPDGSAYFEAPAIRPLFFVALDENDLSVKRMQSFVSVMPGETTGCVGCHERRTDAVANPLHSTLMAVTHRPNKITPIPDVPDVLDFNTRIQPILDAHCTCCHNPRAEAKLSGGVVLTAHRDSQFALWPRSYLTLFAQVAEGRNADGNRAPRTIGSSASPLMKLIEPAHYFVRLSAREKATVRLWIEAGALYPGSYASLGTGGSGMYVAIHTLTRRCGTCHGYRHADGSIRLSFQTPEPEKWDLDEPEKSRMLLAPLAKDAGGLGLCRGEYMVFPNGTKTPARKPDRKARRKNRSDDDELLEGDLDDLLAGEAEPDGLVVDLELPRTVAVPGVFASTADPDYQEILRHLRRRGPWRGRFDMATFRPNEHYIREMKRYGILDKSYTPDQPLDVFALDRAYWRSFWHVPTR